MNLLIMRHGTAEDMSSTGRDQDRSLTSGGRDRVRDVSRALRSAGHDPGRIYSSSLKRAVQTAELVSGVFRPDVAPAVLEICDDLLPDGDASGLAWRLANEAVPTAMFVGHEPQLTDLVGRLLGHRSPVVMQKSMVVGLRFPAGRGHAELGFILDPKSLAFSNS